MKPVIRQSKRAIVAVVGSLIVIIGIILIPYPGPGWLIVFAGFAVLATEFTFAAKTLLSLKNRYELWSVWVKKQPVIIQLLLLSFTGLVVAITAYLLNTFGLIDTFFNLGLEWVHSPIIGK